MNSKREILTQNQYGDIVRQDFTVPSSDGKTRLHGFVWKKNNTAYKGAVQLVHGMVEYIERYHEFALYLAQHDYLVFGHDNLKHGFSINSAKERGNFEYKQGAVQLVQDLNVVTEALSDEISGLKRVILGHSMGSFIVRNYIQEYADDLSGAIIMGTGFESNSLMKASLRLSELLAAIKGPDYISNFLDGLVLGRYSSKFVSEGKTAWLTHDESIRHAYEMDPRTQFTFSVGGYHELFVLASRANRKDLINKTPHDLPILIISGEEDPVGDFGKGPKKLYEIYRELDFPNVSLQLVLNTRHEVLNESNRDNSFEDIRVWIDAYVK
ncbi:MAG: alpha/beta hydrolase [Coriobacteriia bacterium]|nr:alpha/beta hydrolase [Coriobacteriia bacterium]